MFVKSISTGDTSKTVCVTLADEASDGITKFFISSRIWEKLNITAVPFPVDEEIYDAIKLAADKTSAIREASRLIGNGEKSKHDIIKRLKMKKLPDEAVDYAVRMLEKNGYINDAGSCRRLADSLVSSKHYGKRRILEYLLSHGYDKTAAEQAVNAVSAEEYAAAIQYSIEHKYPGVIHADPKEKQKITAGLVRLGFSFDEIRNAIREYIKNN